MPKLNRQQKLLRYLKGQCGYQERATATRKYVKLECVKDGRTLWVGKAGALRQGPTVSSSFSMTSRLDWPKIERWLAEQESDE